MMASDLQRSVDRGLKVNGYRRRAQEIRLGAPSDPGRADQALELCRNNMESLRSAVQRAPWPLTAHWRNGLLEETA
jgi:hypothetical protein